MAGAADDAEGGKYRARARARFIRACRKTRHRPRQTKSAPVFPRPPRGDRSPSPPSALLLLRAGGRVERNFQIEPKLDASKAGGPRDAGFTGRLRQGWEL
jgi:hypothetical protein